MTAEISVLNGISPVFFSPKFQSSKAFIMIYLLRRLRLNTYIRMVAAASAASAAEDHFLNDQNLSFVSILIVFFIETVL